MTAIQALVNAARRAMARKRMIFLYWLFHTLMAALLAAPIAGVAVPMLAHSRYGAELAKDFDWMWLAEAAEMTGRLSPIYVAPGFLVAALMAMLGSVFLAGGAVRLMLADEPAYTPAYFWEGCGKHFWRFLRLTLYSLLFYGIALALGGSLRKVADKIWGEGMEEGPLVYAWRVHQVVLIVLCGFVSTVMDYAKVRLVADDSRKSLRAAFGSVRFVVKNLSTAMGIWLALAVLLGMFTLLYVPGANRLTGGTMNVILLLILWQQVYVFTRIWLRMVSWGAAAEVDAVLRPRPEPPVEFAPVMAAVVEEPPALGTSAAEELPDA